MVELIRQEGGRPRGGRLAVLGWAYKGWPPTDDMRGTPVAAMMPIFRSAGLEVVGHDPMVSGDVIRGYGAEPTSLDKAFGEADAVLILTDHPDYRSMPLSSCSRARPSGCSSLRRVLVEAEVRLPVSGTPVSVTGAVLHQHGIPQHGIPHPGGTA